MTSGKSSAKSLTSEKKPRRSQSARKMSVGNNPKTRESSIKSQQSYTRDLELKNKLLKTELLPIRDELLASQSLVHKLEYEIEASKRNEKAKMSALTENYASLQAMHREKCREVDDLLSVQSQFDSRLADLEKGRDNFRSQYLETREANKQLTMQLKVAQKQLNAQKENNYK